MFRRYYPLEGKDWLRRIPPEDRRVFARYGLSSAVGCHGNWWRFGGLARAASATRDERGRFVKLAQRE